MREPVARKYRVIGCEIAQKALFCWPQRRSPSTEKTRLAATLGRLFRAQPDGTSGRGLDRNQGRRKGADPEGRALFVVRVFLNKIKILFNLGEGQTPLEPFSGP